MRTKDALSNAAGAGFGPISCGNLRQRRNEAVYLAGRTFGA